MQGKHLYCLALKAIALHEAAKNGQDCGFGETCNACPYFDDCRGNWLPMAQELEEEIGISFDFRITSEQMKRLMDSSDCSGQLSRKCLDPRS